MPLIKLVTNKTYYIVMLVA